MTHANQKEYDADRRDRPTRYALGPFSFDEEARTITLAPGIYTVNNPLVFGLAEGQKIDGVNYESLFDVNPSREI